VNETLGSGLAEAQLAAIGAVSAIFEHEQLDYWLFGGWAVDFCVGRVTRDHDDIDLVVWRKDDEAIDAALTATGWQHASVENDVIGAGYTLDGVLLELTLVVSDESGAVVLPLQEGPFVWSSEPFRGERRVLAGVPSTTIPLSLLTSGSRTLGTIPPTPRRIASTSALSPKPAVSPAPAIWPGCWPLPRLRSGHRTAKSGLSSGVIRERSRSRDHAHPATFHSC
jgi:hypothetical protein